MNLIHSQVLVHRLRHLAVHPPLQLRKWLQVRKSQSCCLCCCGPSKSPVFFSSGCFAVVFSAKLPAFTVATFKTQQQTDFKTAVLSKATGATGCTISNMHDGSLVLDSTVTFPKTDSNAATDAANFKNVVSTSPSSVFPSDTYGNVTVGSVTTTSKLNSLLSLPLM